jgi:hypothetical protein
MPADGFDLVGWIGDRAPNPDGLADLDAGLLKPAHHAETLAGFAVQFGEAGRLGDHPPGLGESADGQRDEQTWNPESPCSHGCVFSYR